MRLIFRLSVSKFCADSMRVVASKRSCPFSARFQSVLWRGTPHIMPCECPEPSKRDQLHGPVHAPTRAKWAKLARSATARISGIKRYMSLSRQAESFSNWLANRSSRSTLHKRSATLMVAKLHLMSRCATGRRTSLPTPTKSQKSTEPVLRDLGSGLDEQQQQQAIDYFARGEPRPVRIAAGRTLRFTDHQRRKLGCQSQGTRTRQQRRFNDSAFGHTAMPLAHQIHGRERTFRLDSSDIFSTNVSWWSW